MPPALLSLHDSLLKRSHLALDARWPRGVICNAPGGYGLGEGHLLWFHSKTIHTRESPHCTSRRPLIGSNLQVLGIFIGEGSAGKSVLMALLRLLLGKFYKDMNKDIVVSARGQRAAAKGAASPLEAGEEIIRLKLWIRATRAEYEKCVSPVSPVFDSLTSEFCVLAPSPRLFL
jgi:hypothetical protein